MSFFFYFQDLDYTFVGIYKQDIDNLQHNIQPIVMETEPELNKEDGVIIFQHPKGRPKEYSQEKILHVERPFVYYKADTDTGSSGSPVLTTVGLRLVAIHHKGSEELSYNKGTLCSEVLMHLTSGTCMLFSFFALYLSLLWFVECYCLYIAFDLIGAQWIVSLYWTEIDTDVIAPVFLGYFFGWFVALRPGLHKRISVFKIQAKKASSIKILFFIIPSCKRGLL